MRRSQARVLVTIPYLLLSFSRLAGQLPESQEQFTQGDLRGRIVCPNGSGQIFSCDQDRDESAQSYALETAGGKLYFFLSADPQTKMFSDRRVRARELEITVRLLPDKRVEIIQIHSIKAGRSHRIFYYCDTCSITSFEPGPCYCCYQNFELRETPVPDSLTRLSPC